MSDFRFYYPIEVRYGDLDPQGHLNNSRYLTFFEQARIQYIKHLGLWRGDSFTNIGIILADVHIVFRAAVQFGQPVQVGTRVTRLGNKSMAMDYNIEDQQDGRIMATGSSVLVAYDYHTGHTIAIPDSWRQAILAFEGADRVNHQLQMEDSAQALNSKQERL